MTTPRREVFHGDEPWPSDDAAWLVTMRGLGRLFDELAAIGVSERDAEALIHHFANDAAVQAMHRRKGKENELPSTESRTDQRPG